MEFLESQLIFIIMQLIISSGILGLIAKGIIALQKIIVRNRITKDLFPIYSEGDIQKATKYYISTKCQNIAPSQEYELKHSQAFAVKQKMMPFFLKNAFNHDKDNCRFYLILGDSGMGKTTFLINLYLRYTKRLIKRNYNIKIFPLIMDDIDERIKSIPQREKYNTILLLDAFDENASALKNYKVRLLSLLDLVKDFREVVITCRTQFFPSELEEPTETLIQKTGTEKGYYQIRKLYISPFDNKDINSYLHKKYGRFTLWNMGKKRKAREIIKASPNLMVRPMLLGYIDDLLATTNKFTYGYSIYKELINKWIDREANRVNPKIRTNYKSDLLKFSKEVALDIYSSWINGKYLSIEANKIQPLARRHNIMLSDLELKSRSLLNRDATGKYKFSHKSILEYFLAVEIFKDKNFENNFPFEGMDQARVFFSEMCFEKVCIPYFITNYKENKLTSKLKVEELYNIKYLSLNIENYNPKIIIGLKNLQKLNLTLPNGQNILKIKSKTIYERIRSIKGLKLNSAEIKDINFLIHFPNLKRIDLSNNKIKNISVLSKMKCLQEVNLIDNPIKLDGMDISELQGKISKLQLSENCNSAF